MSSNAKQVKKYYHSLESILGYRLVVGGVKHFGLHKNPDKPDSIRAAQVYEDDVVAQALGAKPGMKILECGCGEGSAANYIASKYGPAVTGLDLLPGNIARARRQSKKLNNGNSFSVGDYMDLTFPDNSFDAIYAMETLVHAPDANELFQGMQRVLKPGGVLVFCEYTMTPRENMSTENQEMMTKVNQLSSMPALEVFTTGSFPKILQANGFKDVVVTDYTANFLPTLRHFWRLGRKPMKLIEKAGLEDHFVNAYSAVRIYEAHLRGEELIQYNLVRATTNK